MSDIPFHHPLTFQNNYSFKMKTKAYYVTYASTYVIFSGVLIISVLFFNSGITASIAMFISSGDVQAHAKSTSSSFPHHHPHHHARKLSMEECNSDMIRPIIWFVIVRDEEFEFDSNGNIIPRNSTISTEEKATIKEEDDCFS